MARVSLRNVIKRYEKLEVVHGINLEIEHNEFVVLVGPSGCGKSTTLRMVAGLEEISDGEVKIGDRLVNDLAPKDRNVAMVFQNYALYPHMNVYNNMAFGLKLSRTPKDEIDRRVKEAAQILGLMDYLERKPAALSGGQRQRVAMGRAIVRHPEVFLFDEPLSNLDAKLRNQMRTEIKKLHQKLGTTVIYVTHDQVEAMTLADRMVIMRDGYIEQEGKPIDVFRNPANTFVAGFIGSPTMNMVPAIIRKTDGNVFVEISNGTLRLPVHEKFSARASLEDGKPVIFGIRPEDVRPTPPHSQFPENWKADATITVVEPLGSESILFVDIGGHEYTGKAGMQHYSMGEKVRFQFNLENSHLFDASTTKAIV
jgi:multiple sugar transport system ATP-binding protein